MKHNRRVPKKRVKVSEAHFKQGEMPTEKQSSRDLKLKMISEGWLVEKVHGSILMRGWPDWFAAHPQYGPRWIETKSFRENHFLEESQQGKFMTWKRYGVGVWVLRGPQDYPLLFDPPNWHLYMKGFV